MKQDKTEILLKLKSILSHYSPPLKAVKDSDKGYELYGTRKITFFKKEIDAMYFSSVLIQKNFVGFYFFPIYTHVELVKEIPPELKKCLKGKSCFHITTLDDVLLKQIQQLVKKGFSLYKKCKLI